MQMILDFIGEPLSFAFMQRAMAITLIIGVVSAVFSCFLILKGWSLMGDAVSHAVFPGLIGAYVLGVPLVAGAFVAGLFCAVMSGVMQAKTRVKSDAIMGIIFSGMFAFGLVLLTRIETDIHIMHVLFGNVLGTSWGDVWYTFVLAGGSFVFMLIKRRDLMLYCFDPVQAGVLGLNERFLSICLLSLLSLTIVVSMQAAGIILIVAMLIAPGATAFLIAQRFDYMVLVAVLSAVLSCFLGVIFSYHLDVATAPLIVVMQAGGFMAAFIRRLLLKT